MLYIQESLLPDEKLVFSSRPHWIVFGPSVVVLVFAGVIWHYLSQYFGNQPIWHNYSFAAILGGLFALCGVVMCLRALLFFTTSEYAVTDRRVVMKMGWLSRDAVEIFLQRVEALNVSQSVLGRILNYGTVIVIGTGGTSDYYPSVPRPMEFHRTVQQQMNALIDRDTKPAILD